MVILVAPEPLDPPEPLEPPEDETFGSGKLVTPWSRMQAEYLNAAPARSRGGGEELWCELDPQAAASSASAVATIARDLSRR